MAALAPIDGHTRAALPYIDRYTREIAATPEQVWPALLAVLGQLVPELPGWLTAAWGLEHRARRGRWQAAVSPGDTLPGFVAAEVQPARVLALRGRHRFSDYELRFELERTPHGGTWLHARTSAAFPGLRGRAYRTLVIGTRLHRVAVLRTLARVGHRAERAGRA